MGVEGLLAAWQGAVTAMLGQEVSLPDVWSVCYLGLHVISG